jgi:hypothetical protein
MPRHKNPEDDRCITMRFAVRLISKNVIIEYMEIRDG